MKRRGAGVLKNLNKRTYGNLISGREDVLNSIRESLSDYTVKREKRSGRKKRKRSCIWWIGRSGDMASLMT